MNSQNINRLTRSLLAWFADAARDLPWRRTHDPYAIWVSEIMLQQTQVKTVIPYWDRWMAALPTPAAAAAAPLEQIHKLWEGLGYYTRVRNLQRAAQVIVAEHGGRFPECYAAVLALPGIGRYTAGAVCSIAFNQPTPILDGNVIRVLTRLFAIAENPKEKATNARLWQLAEQLVKQAQTLSGGPSHLNQALMELGALICTPRQPQCLLCPVQSACAAYRQQRTEELPNLGERAATTARAFMAFVLFARGEVLVQQRPAEGVNAHLWEFPNVEVTGEESAATTVFEAKFRLAAPPLTPLRVVKHAITRYRITLTAYQATLPRRPAKLPGRWVPLAGLDQLAFASAHKKVAQAALNPAT